MANQPGDLLATLENTIYVIEASLVGSGNSSWSPIPVNATPQTRKLESDQNRIMKANLIDLSGIFAYRHREHAQAAFNAMIAGAKSVQFRIVKMEATIIKTFDSGTPD